MFFKFVLLWKVQSEIWYMWWSNPSLEIIASDGVTFISAGIISFDQKAMRLHLPLAPHIVVRIIGSLFSLTNTAGFSDCCEQVLVNYFLASFLHLQPNSFDQATIYHKLAKYCHWKDSLKLIDKQKNWIT